jgi:tetratricopeptide (TPR) repeat protein
VAYVNRANFFNVASKPERALADANRAVELDPDLPLTNFVRAAAATELEDYDSAVADYSTAIRMRPNFAQLYDLRGRVYHKKGDEDRAIADYDERLRREMDVGTLLNRGDARRNKKDWPGAAEDYSQAIRLAPTNPGGYKGRGFIRLVTQDFKGSVEDFTEAAKFQPNEAAIYTNRGSACPCWANASGPCPITIRPSGLNRSIRSTMSAGRCCSTRWVTARQR